MTLGRKRLTKTTPLPKSDPLLHAETHLKHGLCNNASSQTYLGASTPSEGGYIINACRSSKINEML